MAIWLSPRCIPWSGRSDPEGERAQRIYEIKKAVEATVPSRWRDEKWTPAGSCIYTMKDRDPICEIPVLQVSRFLPLCERKISREEASPSENCSRFLDKPELFLAAHPFDMPFPAHSIVLLRELFKIYQCNGSTRACIFCSRSFVMRGHTLLEICCPAAIQGSVWAAEKVNIVHFV